MKTIIRSLVGVALIAAMASLSGERLAAQSGADVQKAVDAAYAKFRTLQ
jgi:type II secretory pathway pseudopilin PulG